MTRKNILKGLLEGSGSEAPALPQRAPIGAIGAVGRSIADIKARAVVELDPHLIDSGGMADRLENDVAEDATLMQSIAEHGQQVPVLVRPHPEAPGRFQIVYGRRRVLALRDLGQPVKALIRDLDDRALVLAQGQENNVRRNLSFIEKVNFARQLEEAGYDRKVICDALAIDKTTASRMLAVATRVPRAVIEAIGAAPTVGRDRWVALTEMMEDRDITPEEVAAMVVLAGADADSDARFAAAVAYLSRSEGRALAAPPAPPAADDPPPTRTERRPLRGGDGQRLGQVLRGARSVTLRFDTARTDGFENWLLANLADLHRRWESTVLPGGDDDDP